MNAHRILTPERVPATERTRIQLRVIQPDPSLARRRRNEGDLFLALMCACLMLFAIAFALYVVNPAVTTVTGAPAESMELI